MKRRSVTEILTEIGEAPNFQERVKAMRSYRENSAMREVLRYAYNPDIKFLLPKGSPPYRENDFPDQQHLLYPEVRKFYMFIEGGHQALSQQNPKMALKREQLWVRLLETVDKDDAKTLIGMKDKDIPIKGITEKLVQRAFPDLFK